MTKPTGGAVGRPVSEELAEKHKQAQNFKNNPINDNPKRPTGLQTAGKKAWDDIWETGRVNVEEAALAAEYCFLVDEVAVRRRFIKTLEANNKLFVEVGVNGALQPHPALLALKDARQLLLAFQRELILSPSSRVKANIEIEKQADKTMENFIRRAEMREVERKEGAA